jgi:hypothetical protein
MPDGKDAAAIEEEVLLDLEVYWNMNNSDLAEGYRVGLEEMRADRQLNSFRENG